jgi:hypothetical protein
MLAVRAAGGSRVTADPSGFDADSSTAGVICSDVRVASMEILPLRI